MSTTSAKLACCKPAAASRSILGRSAFAEGRETPRGRKRSVSPCRRRPCAVEVEDEGQVRGGRSWRSSAGPGCGNGATTLKRFSPFGRPRRGLAGRPALSEATPCALSGSAIRRARAEPRRTASGGAKPGWKPYRGHGPGRAATTVAPGATSCEHRNWRRPWPFHDSMGREHARPTEDHPVRRVGWRLPPTPRRIGPARGGWYTSRIADIGASPRRRAVTMKQFRPIGSRIGRCVGSAQDVTMRARRELPTYAMAERSCRAPTPG